MTGVAEVVRILVVLLLIALVVILVTRRLAFPYTLGLVIVGFIMSLFAIIPEFHLTPDLVLFVFLPGLLFEGSWSISLHRLRANWLAIFLLAVPGLLLELVLIALPLHFLAHFAWNIALLLAAILSPTDPVAVLGLFRQLRINADLATIIEGESLFNDGVAGALYQTLLALVLLSMQGQPLPVGAALLHGLGTFLLEAGGGILVGGICGYLVSRLVKFIDDHLIETTITIVVAYGVYLLADSLHVSGILAVILAGLILGSYGRDTGMSERTSEAVDDFWSMIAFLANALLFLLVGAQLNPTQILASAQERPLLLIAILVIVAVLAARFIMVALLPHGLPPAPGKRLPAWRFVIFWSGLRGALSLALVLALPLNVPEHDALEFSTYAVVLFTLLVQGFSLGLILKRLPSLSERTS